MEDAKIDDPAADILRAAIEDLTRKELLGIVTSLLSSPSTRSYIQSLLPISAQLLKSQPKDPEQVAKINQMVTNFVKDFNSYYHYDDYGELDNEDGNYEVLDEAISQASLLHPEDGLMVARHVIVAPQEIFGDTMFGTESFEEALRFYGKLLAEVDFTTALKHDHFRWLISLLKPEAGYYGELNDAVGEALSIAATKPEDYKFLIDELGDTAEASRWVIRYHLALGDDKTYLRMSNQNLSCEDDYLELAEYWRQKGNTAAYIKTLEQWCTDLAAKIQDDEYYHSIRSSSRGVTARLSEYYADQKDGVNLLRILLFCAKYGVLSLELYKQLQTVSGRLGNWLDIRKKVMALAKKHPQILAQIYLY